MPIDDGGPAFPRQPGGNGMSLRDYYAAAALPGVLEKYGTTQLFDKLAYGLVAAHCFKMADAMLIARTNAWPIPFSRFTEPDVSRFEMPTKEATGETI